MLDRQSHGVERPQLAVLTEGTQNLFSSFSYASIVFAM